METKLKLYMLMLGCRPTGRFTEQHDIFFGISDSLKNLIPDIKRFWPEAKGKIHVDVWREINVVENFIIEVCEKSETVANQNELFFINLGGYKPNEFDKFHYKMVTVGKNLSEASKKSKETTFYKHTGFEGAISHIDDKYGLDIDDVFNVKDILNQRYKDLCTLKITKSEQQLPEDILHIGYLKLEKIS